MISGYFEWWDHHLWLATCAAVFCIGWLIGDWLIRKIDGWLTQKKGGRK